MFSSLPWGLGASDERPCPGSWGRNCFENQNEKLKTPHWHSSFASLNTLHVGWFVQVTPEYPGSCVTAALCGSQRGVALPVAGEPCEGNPFHSAHGILTAVQSRGENRSHCVLGGSLPLSSGASTVCARKPYVPCSSWGASTQFPLSTEFSSSF